LRGKNRKKLEERKVRVLIIDDDATFCELLAETLEEKGMDVEWTTDGFGGYEMSLDQPYDLFILDQRMPLVLGSELAEYLREDNPEAKIILTSAFADETLSDIAKKIDSPLLSKPFAADRLLELIKRVLSPFKQTQ
jgi:DNA-binding NtrC family response regulator